MDGRTDRQTYGRTYGRADGRLRPNVLGRLGGVDLIIAPICCMYIVYSASW